MISTNSHLTGQATCERTMTIVKQLNKLCKEKVIYILSRADEIQTETERHDVLIQLSQNLSKQLVDTAADSYYGEHALKVKTIYLPSKCRREIKADFNQIEDVCESIDQVIEAKVQQHCSNLEDHCKAIRGSIDEYVCVASLSAYLISRVVDIISLTNHSKHALMC